MADWLVSIGLDDREGRESLKRFQELGGKTGQALGQNLVTGFSKEASDLPIGVNKALAGLKGIGAKVGKGIGADLLSGAAGGFKGLPQIAGQAGAKAGKQVTASVVRGLGGIPTALQSSLASGGAKAGTEGGRAGTAFILGLQKSLKVVGPSFDAVVNEARAAAQMIGATFDAVDLRFKTESGQLIPQEELDRMRQINPVLDSAVTSVNNYRAANQSATPAVKGLGAQITQLANSGGLVQSAITGMAFALSDRLFQALSSVRRALTGALVGFAALDAELRKGAAAASEDGAYERLSTAVRRVALNSSASTSELAVLNTELVRMGFTVTDVENTLGGIVRASEASGTAFENMGNIVGQALVTFQLGSDQIGRVTDVLVNGANLSAASMDSLGEALGYAGPVAATLGITIEDVVGTLSLLSQAGLDGSIAGRGLATGLTRLQRALSTTNPEVIGLTAGQDRLAEAIRILGNDLADTNGKVSLTGDGLVKLKDAFDELGDAQRLELSSAIFGLDAGPKFLALLNQSEDQIRSMSDAINSSAGVADATRDKMESLGLSLSRLESATGAVANVFGSVIGGAIKPFIDAFSGALAVVSEIPAPIQRAVAALALLGGAYASARIAVEVFRAAMKTEIVAGTVSELTQLSKSLRQTFGADIGKAKAQWGTLIQALSRSSFGPVIQGLGDLRRSMTTTFNAQQFRQGIENIFGGLRQSAGKAVPYVVSQLRLLYQAANAKFGAGVLGAAKGFQILRAQMLNAGQGMLAVSKQSSGLSRVLLQGLGSGLQAASKALGIFKVQAVATAAASAGLATTLGAVALAVAAVAAVILVYNSYMSEARKATEGTQKRIDELTKSLREAGVETERLVTLGGPLEEAWAGLGYAVKDLSAPLKAIEQDTAKAAKSALDWGTALQSLPAILAKLTTTFLPGLIQKIREWWNEVQKAKQLEQLDLGLKNLDTRFGEASDGVGRLSAEFANLGKDADPKALAELEGRAGKLVGTMGTLRQNINDQAGAWRQLAGQYRAAGDEDVARRFDQAAAALEAMLPAVEDNADELGRLGKEAGVSVPKLDELTRTLKEVEDGLASLEREGQIGLAQEEVRLLKEVAEGNITAEQAALGKAEATAKALDAQIAYLKQELALQDKSTEGTEERQKLELALAQTEAERARLGLDLIKQRQAAEGNATSASVEGTKERIAAENELNRAISSRPVENLKRQTEYANGLLQYARAMEGLEQSEFNLAIARNKFELDAAEKRGATEQQLATIRKRGEELNKEAVLARYRNLLAIQEVELLIFSLKQRQSQLEAKKGLNDSRLAELAAEAALLDVVNTGSAEQVRAAQMKLQLAREATKLAGEQVALEQAMVAPAQAAIAASQETARNQVAAEAAGLGLSQSMLDAAGSAEFMATQTGKLPEGLAEGVQQAANLTQQIGEGSVDLYQEVASVTGQAAGQAGDLARNMNQATNQARQFYEYLNAAANVPAGRFTGGPVTGGESYKVNELGQEAFLSRSGKLSLIERGRNAMWRAPSSGIVLPASLTSTLDEAGLLNAGRRVSHADTVAGRGAPAAPPLGGEPTHALLRRMNAKLAKLSAAVQDLPGRDWQLKLQGGNGPARRATDLNHRLSSLL